MITTPTATHDAGCSCGKPGPHVVARARTFDGVQLELHSTGDITGVLGMYPPGMSAARDHGRAMRAARLAWEEAGLYDWSELGDLIRAARRAVVQQAFPPLVYLRRSMAGEKFRRMGRNGAVIVAERKG